ncbi:hypothetical protein GWI33_020099 [Rhynchophorus ferrugineus]|uniref:Uncharacterized protein n=1 Tax=Rhynchophorus ferrugineus TaxID=354439 RepID=A0A834M6B0_RHYFE|nr:hypothetical protein GWI33_020099 [Rhynchophorus ferrugineus]
MTDDLNNDPDDVMTTTGERHWKSNADDSAVRSFHHAPLPSLRRGESTSATTFTHHVLLFGEECAFFAVIVP